MNNTNVNSNDPKKWECLEQNLYADCKVFKVIKKTFAHPDGRKSDFFVNHSKDWVQVAALVDVPDASEPFVVLVNQFRFGALKNSWEFPGGVCDNDENPVQTAIRELQEETGFKGSNAKLVASYSPNPAIQDNLAHFVIIENCKKISDVNWDENEEIQTKLVPISMLDDMVESGLIYHCIAIASTYFLKRYLAKKTAQLNKQNL